MDANLERNERIATKQEWDEGDWPWAVSLSPPQLTGIGLQVFSSMPPGDANNYEKLKTVGIQNPMDSLILCLQGLRLFKCSAVAVNFVKVGLIETQRVF